MKPSPNCPRCDYPDTDKRPSEHQISAGKARMSKLTKAQRSALAKKAGLAAAKARKERP